MAENSLGSQLLSPIFDKFKQFNKKSKVKYFNYCINFYFSNIYIKRSHNNKNQAIN